MRWTSPVQIYLWATAFFFAVHALRPFVLMEVAGEVPRIFAVLGAAEMGLRVPAETLSALEESGRSLNGFRLRFDAAVAGYLPVLLVGIVPATGLLLAAVTGSRRWVRHGVLALHWSAVYFVAEGLRQLLRFPSPLLAVLIGPWLVAAVRTVYGVSWIGALLRALVVVTVFGGLLVLWLGSTIQIGLRIAQG